MNGAVVDPFFLSCSTPLAPGATCSGSFSAGVDGWCFFDVRGKVRAAIGVYDGNGGGIVTALPATTK